MGPVLVCVVVATIAGLMAGSANQRAKRARLDYRRTKGLIPAARKLAWAETLRGLAVVATATTALVVMALIMYTIGLRA
jgi:hypothetical protein